MKHGGILKAALLASLYALTSVLSGCIVAEPREGYYDHDHARYYHHHAWVTCRDRDDEHCR